MTALSDWFHLTPDIGENGLTVTRAATAEEETELARELDLISCELAATYTLTPVGAGRFRFAGKLDAAVTQPCVVTLEPVPAEIRETFSIELWPAETLPEEAPVAGDREVSSIPDVEPIADGRIEVGHLVFSLLSAALPPYPRKDGATFDWVDPKSTEEGTANPFAALAKLKPRS